MIYLKASPVFKPFFKTLAALKIKHEALKPSMTHEEILAYFQDINETMNLTEPHLRLAPETLSPNYPLRSFLKAFSNIILG